MGKESHIEWTDATHNFWYGCRRVSPGCAMCYADREMTRYGRDFNTVTRAKGFSKPLGWRKAGHAPGGGLLIFVNSWSDFFIEESDPWRDEAWEVIRRTPQNTYQILTKRPERIRECLPEDWGNGWLNVWLGTSIEMQSYMHRMATLGKVPARVRFVSAEPLLGPLDFLGYQHGIWFRTIQWVIVGGESDYRKPRPMKLEWARNIMEQCRSESIAFFLKQLGGTYKCSCHGSYGCCLLEGEVWREMPVVRDRSH